MKKNFKIKFAIIFGVLHFVVIILSFLFLHGEQGMFILFIDFPIYLLIGSLGFGNLLLNNLAFNIFAFSILGTLMYAFWGYCVGLLWDSIGKITKATGATGKKIQLAIMFGIAHFAIVGLPLIFRGGDTLKYMLGIDLPLLLLAYPLTLFAYNFGIILYSKVLFNLIFFVIFGTIMYSFLGYGIGSLIGKIKKEKQ